MEILGLTWTVKEDILTLTSQITKNLGLTKRIVFQQISSVYDPLGLFSPVTLRGKLSLQTLWDQKISWDEYLSEQDKSSPFEYCYSGIYSEKDHNSL